MSVEIRVIGRLGNKPEVKTTRNGNEYATFNIAVDEYSNGERGTTWFAVADFTPSAKRRAEFLNKGSLITVTGIETVRLYKDRDGLPQIARDIRATYIDFVPVGNGNKQQEQTVNTNCGTLTSQPQSQPVQQPQQQVVSQQQPVNQVAVTPNQPVQAMNEQVRPQQPMQQVVHQPVQQVVQPQQQFASAGAASNQYEDDLPF